MKGWKPPARGFHSASCITDIHLDHHPVLVVVGGYDGGVSALSDVWLFDLANRQWKKVCFFHSILKRGVGMANNENSRNSYIHICIFNLIYT